MTLGRVMGCVVATIKTPALTGQRLLIVQPIRPNGTATGKQVICLDAVGVGAGETIYYCGGKESSFPFKPAELPVDRTIVAIVDEINADEINANEINADEINADKISVDPIQAEPATC